MESTKKARVIALYLPQYHPVAEMINTGERDSPNGRMWLRQSHYLKGIISPESLQI